MFFKNFEKFNSALIATSIVMGTQELSRIAFSKAVTLLTDAMPRKLIDIILLGMRATGPPRHRCQRVEQATETESND